MGDVEYRSIPNFPRYRVGSDGTMWTRNRAGEWRQMKPNKVGTNRAYSAVVLCCEGRQRRVYVHHLVLELFVGPCPEGLEAIHENDDQSDNRVVNLSWGTHARNCELRRINGKQTYGEQRSHSKLTDAGVRWIRANQHALTLREMGEKLGVHIATVSDVIRGLTWKHVL